MAPTSVTQLISVSFMVCVAYEFAVAVPTCSIALKCSSNPPLAWATDGQNCLIFQNDCQLRSQNCQRENNQELAYSTVEKNDCLKKYCRDACSKEMNPVCTIHKNESQTFLNTCLWTKEMCKSGKEYVFQFEGSCEPAT